VIYNDDADQSEISVIREKINNELWLIKINNIEFIEYRSPLKFGKKLIANRWGAEYVEGKEEEFSIDRPIEIVFPVVTDDAEKDAKNKKGLFYSYLPTEMYNGSVVKTKNKVFYNELICM
jgi:hypothetical protein